MPTLVFLYALAVLSVATPLIAGQPFDHAHPQFAAVLTVVATNGAVDYRVLQDGPEPLNHYLRSLSEVSSADYGSWTRDQKLAFLINAYNAAVLQLVRDHYPVKSVKRIGGWFENPFRIKFIALLGQKLSLDDLEHDMIRRDFTEPRIHFALVCAARSCPPLRGEPYVAERLSAQLTEQGKLFLADRSKNRFDGKARVLYLSPIFKWFSNDFGGREEAIVAFVTPYFPEPIQKELARKPDKLRYTDYDWSLNQSRR